MQSEHTEGEKPLASFWKDSKFALPLALATILQFPLMIMVFEACSNV